MFELIASAASGAEALDFKEDGMTNTRYEEPDKDFFIEQFSRMPFGMIKPSELELLLFYLLAYYQGDLEKSEFEIADKYRITEAKAAKFKLEIGRRFTGKTSADYLRELAKKIFEEKSVTLEIDGAKIGVPVYNPCYLRAMKYALAVNQIPYDTGNNGRLIKLQAWNFIAVFAKSGYTAIQKHIGGFIAKQTEHRDEFIKIFESGVPLSARMLGFLKDNALPILEMLPVVKDFTPLLGTALKTLKK